MELSKIKYTASGKPYFQYWTDSAIKRGNRKKGYWVRTGGEIRNCPVCSKQFFIGSSFTKQKHIVRTCSPKCAGSLRRGKNNPHWNGGRYIDKEGYVYVPAPEHPNKDKRGYIREHRLVVEQKIGRPLERWEVVHHINHNRADNRIENLELVSHTHNRDVESQLKKEIKRLRLILNSHGLQY